MRYNLRYNFNQVQLKILFQHSGRITITIMMNDMDLEGQILVHIDIAS